MVARGLKPDAHISVSRPGSGRRRASGSSRPPSPPCVAVMVARVPADASVIPRDPNARRDPNPNALGITLKRDLTRKDTIGSQKIVEGLQAGLLASNARVLDLFRAWDTDNDGRVSREEFHAAFRAMASDHPERLIDETFDAFGAHAYILCRNRRVHIICAARTATGRALADRPCGPIMPTPFPSRPRVHVPPPLPTSANRAS